MRKTSPAWSAPGAAIEIHLALCLNRAVCFVAQMSIVLLPYHPSLEEPLKAARAGGCMGAQTNEHAQEWPNPPLACDLTGYARTERMYSNLVPL